jgi:hypothetical protein
VWHSIMRQYVPAEEWREVEREVERLAGAADGEAGFVRVCFEPRVVEGREGFWLVAQRAGEPERLLATARPHGLPASGGAWRPSDVS